MDSHETRASERTTDIVISGVIALGDETFEAVTLIMLQNETDASLPLVS